MPKHANYMGRMDRKQEESVMEKPEISIHRDRLLALRARLEHEMNYLADAALSATSSESNSLPTHIADLGSDSFEQELTLNLVGTEKEALQRIATALERIGDGSYGLCEDCGDPIPDVRLEAIPYASLCVECATERERNGDE